MREVAGHHTAGTEQEGQDEKEYPGAFFMLPTPSPKLAGPRDRPAGLSVEEIISISDRSRWPSASVSSLARATVSAVELRGRQLHVTGAQDKDVLRPGGLKRIGSTLKGC